MGKDRLGFVGVTTARSTIRRLFPLWADHLGLEAEIEGYDLPMSATAADYRRCVDAIRRDPGVRGALVTTHKTSVLEHAGDHFDEIDHFAQLCREISCISKRDGRLRGSAKDPITAGAAFHRMVGRDYWTKAPDAQVLCLGAGGAGLAIAAMFAGGEPAPAAVVVADRDPARVDEVRRVADLVGGQLDARVVSSAEDNDELVSMLSPRSLVINATGMGKDLPGAPVTGAARFPEDGLVWELNYRGELEFLHLAARQAEPRDLRLYDGWVYFLYGWAEVVAEVFDIELTEELFTELELVAGSLGHDPVVAVAG